MVVVEVGDAQMGFEAGTSVVVGGVSLCWNCGGGDSGNGDEGELFCVAGVDRIGGSNAGSGVFETEVGGGGVGTGGWDGIGICKNCK